ncbi:MAG: acetolactate synthase small subunit [Anaerolineae bacterium]|nr:acetolactate synthase small subunit [Anaerolineae bacterium]
MRQTLIAIVENKPGVLNRVASLFRRRNFNIDSLNVGRTEDPRFSRMTIVVDSQDTEARLVEANLYKLVNVIDVQDVTRQPAVVRELALIKVEAPPERRAEVLSLADIFKAKIVDVGPDSLILQVVADEERVDSLVELLRPCGILELLRTGHVAMTRGRTDGVRHTPGAGRNGHHRLAGEALAAATDIQ